jgi:hypothetical protein
VTPSRQLANESQLASVTARAAIANALPTRSSRRERAGFARGVRPAWREGVQPRQRVAHHPATQPFSGGKQSPGLPIRRPVGISGVPGELQLQVLDRDSRRGERRGFA